MRAKNKIYKFNSSLIVKNNPIYIESINFKNNEDIETKINLKGSYDQKNRIQFNLVSLKDENNEILAKDIILDNENKLLIWILKLDYYDADNLKNSAKIKKRNKEYFLDGTVLNFDNFIENLLNNDDQNNLKISNKKYKLNINLEKVHLDKNSIVNDFFGSLIFENKKIKNAKISGFFSKNKKIEFTVNSTNSGKVTTLFVDKADSIVKRYKFIKIDIAGPIA